MFAPALPERFGDEHQVGQAVVHAHAVLVDHLEAGGDAAAVALPGGEKWKGN